MTGRLTKDGPTCNACLKPSEATEPGLPDSLGHIWCARCNKIVEPNKGRRAPMEQELAVHQWEIGEHITYRNEHATVEKVSTEGKRLYIAIGARKLWVPTETCQPILKGGPTMKKNTAKKNTTKKAEKKAAPAKKIEKAQEKKNGGLVNKGYTELFTSTISKTPMSLADAKKAVLAVHPDCRTNFGKTLKGLVDKGKAKVDKNGIITIK